MLHILQIGRGGYIDGGGTYDQVGAVDEPLLQGLVEAQQFLLLYNIAMPMEHHLTLIAR